MAHSEGWIYLSSLLFSIGADMRADDYLYDTNDGRVHS